MDARLTEYEEFFRADFLAWLAQNRDIYAAFERQAFALINAGRSHFSARTIVEELRHFSRYKEKADGGFKINNNRTPDMARVFVILHPAYWKFWEYRREDWHAFIDKVVPPELRDRDSA